MVSLILSLSAAAAYMLTAALIGSALANAMNGQLIDNHVEPATSKPDSSNPQRWRFAAAVAGCLAISALAISMLGTNGTLQLSLTNSAALVCTVIAILLTLISFQSRIETLGLALFPLAGISVVAAAIVPADTATISGGPGLKTHIVLSLLAYSLLSIAAMQAVLLAIQESRLRRHKVDKWSAALPPLQSMETWMFQLIAVGFLLLSGSLATGMLFVENILAQHLLHKLVFSIAAWLIFATLLWGRWRYGWRGRKAIRWTLAGCLLLALAYFGAKWVLEILLNERWG